ncbi:hypothetical protein RQM65_00470 [Pricia sp. S334]|uniref:Lipoprotein n=1 Tax=Pricia mediterranea TaxID=3076079 RepID=A0ABU3L077_9FLAO|nr:hypothetical protein [Pricia sp. S334]MDT7827136.1 hypothetical protein [Pricia sp. S334]
MKSQTVHLILMLLLMSACGNRNSAQPDPEDEYRRTEASYEPESRSGFFDSFNKKKLMSNQFRDARTGLVVSSSNYPSDWKVISSEGRFDTFVFKYKKRVPKQYESI